ncbi:MAG TPA: polysaccharide biosynthesis/export family protein [Patescibacteria group bacterium]|nr:polysaccharide biosynthesis/export family protein [Patescibacteria group bacterium]
MSCHAKPARRNALPPFPVVLLGIATLALGMPLLGRPAPRRAQDRPVSRSPARLPKEPGAKAANPAAGALPLAEYTIGPGDLLNVYVVAVPELSRNYRVSPGGRITLPMLDHPVMAQGLTPDELSEAIGQALRRQGLISHPDVLVSVESSPGNSIAVTGSVVKPGVYPVFGSTTIIAILSRAGGLSPDAGSTAVVHRGPRAMHLLEASGAAGTLNPPPQRARIVKVPIRHLFESGDEPQDLLLYPGDDIDVPRAGVVYVVGAVNRAGGFALTGEQNQLTVLQAIALAGNVTRTAVLKDAWIIRPNPRNSAGRQQIRVNLKEILSGKAPDRGLGSGDILFIPDSTGKQVLARALAAITSVAIYRVPL